MGVYKTGEHFTVKSSTKVIVKNALQFRRGGKTVGALDAVYDFKELPPELHSMAVRMISRTQNLMLPPVVSMDPILTLNDLRTAITSVRGIRSCSIETEIGQAKVAVRYSWWTYLWFGLKKKAAKRVADYIYDRIPFGVGFSMGAKVDAERFQGGVM